MHVLKEIQKIHAFVLMQFVIGGSIGNKLALVQVMACRMFGANPLPEPTLNNDP